MTGYLQLTTPLLSLAFVASASAQALEQAAPAPAPTPADQAAPAPVEQAAPPSGTSTPTMERSAASPAAAAPAASSEADEYEALIASALDHYQRGRFIEARALFQQAHELYPSARPLRGIGLCAFELGDYAAAVRHLDAAMHELRRPLDDGLRAETGKVLDRARAFVGTLELRVSPPDARVTVGAQHGVVGALVLNPGVHVVRVQAPGHVPQEQRVRVRGGQTTALVIALAPQATPALPGPPPAAAPHPQRAARTGPLLLGGLGVAALVGGTITALLTASAKDDLDASCARGECDESARSRGRTTKTLTNVLLPTGAGLVVGAALWWLLDDSGVEAATRATSVTAGCDGDGCGLALRGAF
jgi:tetratricopeptide (TPR) repeat protein